MKRLTWLATIFGFLSLGCMAATAQVAVVIGPRSVVVPRPPVVAVRPVPVYPAPVVYRPAIAPVVVPRPYYPVARPVVVYRRPVFYCPGPVRREYLRHERWEYPRGRW